MKKILTLRILSASALVLVSSMALAEETGTQTHPCKVIIEACKTAGFQKGGHKKESKGLYLDCLEPLLKGQSVPGVTVDAATVQACQARQAKRHKAKK